MIINLANKKFCTISRVDGSSVIVNSSNGSTLTTTTVSNSSTNQSSEVAVADEQIQLYDGSILKRIRDNLIVA